MVLHNFILFINIAVLVGIIGLIMYHIEIKWKPLGMLKCKLGLHKRTKKEHGKKVRTYHCVFCSKAKNYPHLKVVDGGKKDHKSCFKW